MTTNQTIDGVPRELRALLERVVGKASQTPHWDALDEDRIAATAELRALLDAPAKPVEPVAYPTLSALLADLPEGYNKDDVAFGWNECVDNHRCSAAQPQGEPVYMVRSHGSDCWEEMSGESLELCQADPGEYEVRKLYSEQPAPVALK